MEHKVAKTSEILPGTMKQVRAGDKVICVANVDGEFFAIGDTCTHEECSLSTGYLDGNAVICSCHGGMFDVTTGEVMSPPPPAPEPTYKVTVQGEDVYIEV